MSDFCTITTSDHLYKAHALFDSLKEQDENVRLHILCVNDTFAPVENDGLRYYRTAEVCTNALAQTIVSKYSSNADKLRWSLKPVFLNYLLQSGLRKIIYADNDLYFFSTYDFLFKLLDEYNFLLTPHYYSFDPTKDQNWFEANFKIGLYNAGFVGVSSTAADYLNWWTACCAYRCEKNPLRGMYDDQKYLDLLPILNPSAHIVRHRGCNIADWNRSEIKRSVRNGIVYLDEKDPLVFVHFNYTTIRAIHQGLEPALEACFEKYFLNLQKYFPYVERKNMYGPDKPLHRLKYRIWKLLTDRDF